MILLATATPWETDPLKTRWRLREGALAGCYEGSVSGHALRLLETGIGADSTKARLERLLAAEERFKPELVISSGLAGALQPGLKAGELVADLREAPLEIVRSARETAARLKLPLHLGAFYTSDRVLEPALKREAGRLKRALAVDMESASLRAWSAQRGAAFVGLRAVLDTVDGRLPSGVPESGGLAALARYVAEHVGEFPLMLRLWPAQRRGMDSLGRFLESWLSTL